MKKLSILLSFLFLGISLIYGQTHKGSTTYYGNQLYRAPRPSYYPVSEEQVPNTKVREGIRQIENYFKRNSQKSTSTTAASSARIPAKRQPKVWGVIVGISDYPYLQSLRYADDDALRLYNFLKKDKGQSGDNSNFTVLLNAQATRKNILDKLREVFNRADENDMILLYYSGHGLPDALVASDYNGYHNTIRHEEIRRIFDQSKAKRKLCIIDACHSGSFLNQKMNGVAGQLTGFTQGRFSIDSGTAMLLSSRSSEESYECQDLQQGVFTHFLLRGLQGEADRDFDRKVSIQELYEFTSGKVSAYTSFQQRPMLGSSAYTLASAKVI